MANIYKFKQAGKNELICCTVCARKKKLDDRKEIYPLSDPRGHHCSTELNNDREINWYLYKSGWWEISAKEKRPNKTKRRWYYYKSLWYCPVCAQKNRMPKRDSSLQVLDRLFGSKVLEPDFSSLRDFRWSVRMKLDDH
jgi:hypothetical protein